jgi:hypothetical protein
VPLGGKTERTVLSLDCKRKMRFYFTKTLFIEEPKKCVKEGSVNCKSLYSGPIREPGGGFVYWGI